MKPISINNPVQFTEETPEDVKSVVKALVNPAFETICKRLDELEARLPKPEETPEASESVEPPKRRGRPKAQQ